MKTISVREVAEALGISTRGVLYRREKGHLKGILVKNERGVDEYRIYPTKEIIEGLKKINSPLVASPDAIEGFDVVDAQTVTEEDTIYDSTFGPDDVVEPTQTTSQRSEWSDNARTAANGMADELWNNVISRFMEKLEKKDQLIGEMRVEIQEKDRQLKLLPDFQKQAEDKRKEAELKELEAVALRKQVDAQKEAKETEIAQLNSDLETARMEREAKEEAAKLLEQENELLRKRAEEAALSAAKLELLENEILLLKKPKPSWFQKLFMPADGQ